jgi:hypothetical protein
MSCAFLWNGTTTHPKGGLSGHISLLRTTVALSDGFPAPVILLLIFILNEKRGLFGGIPPSRDLFALVLAERPQPFGPMETVGKIFELVKEGRMVSRNRGNYSDRFRHTYPETKLGQTFR